MKDEIQNAVTFVANFLRGLSSEQVLAFKLNLVEVLNCHYKGHWFPEKPCRGSAYRCIRVNKQRMDPLLASAGFDAGLTEALLLQHFPSEFTIWIDPNEVSYRFGEDGSIGVIFDCNLVNHEERDTQAVSESSSRMHGIYESCRKQVHDLFQSSASRDCLRSFVMF